MNPEDSVSFVLRCGSVIGIIVIAIGVVAYFADLDMFEGIMLSGITIIVFTPFARMIASFITLSVNREKRYAVSALILIAITIIGMGVGYWLG